MILTLVIVMFFINFIPFVIYYRQYKKLKKQRGNNVQHDELVGRMMRASNFISPAIVVILVLVYFLQ